MKATRQMHFGHVLTDKDQVILEVDDAYVAIVGRERHELVGRKALSFTYGEDLVRNQPMLDRLAANGPAFTITKRYVRGDGAIVWVRNQVSTLTSGSQGGSVCATCTPIESPLGIGKVTAHHSAVLQLCGALVIGRKLFTKDIVSIPGAEALLMLYRAEVEGKVTSTRDLADHIELPVGVTQRWISLLRDRGLVENEREGATVDVPLRISRSAEVTIERLLTEIG